MKGKIYLLTCLAALALAGNSGFGADTTTPAATTTPATATPAVSPATPKPAPKRRTQDDSVTPLVKDPYRHAEFLYRIKEGEVGLLFLGDSITDNWPRHGESSWLKFAPYHPANFGVSGDCTEHVLWRITNGELDGIKPKVTVIMIGTNNLSRGEEQPEWTAAGVKKIVDTVHEKLPGTKVLLLAIFPRAMKESPLRQKVDEANKIIAGFDDGKGTRFLDIGKVFLDETGEIPKDIMPDSLHPSAKGYDLWYEAMRPLLEEMLK